MDAVAVDLTTDELRDAGLRVVRVVVPQLMPISFTHRARYLGTPRLSAYVARRTGAPFTEADVNPAPLPFA
jgi:ribosomal protein S12 methylthiotransferase accessory factor